MSDKNQTIGNPEDVKAVSAETFQCPGCGANMRFDAESGCLKCDYCGTVKKLERSDDFSERDFSEFENIEKWGGEVKEAVCKNCGATEVYRANEVATVCPFCSSPMVLSEEDYTGLKPNVIVPFAKKVTEAAALCKKWLKRRIFSPGRFKKNLKVDNISGVYYPIWTFDSQTITDYSGVLGKYVTRTYTRNGKTVTRTETEYFHVKGQIRRIFDDLMIRGTDKLDVKAENDSGFTQKDYVKFDNAYLAGYSAMGYTVQPLDAWKRAEGIMKERIKNEIMRRYGADTVQRLDMRLYHEGRSFKYLLAPFYVSVCMYKDKLYRQFVDGVKGKVYGKAPVSPLRVAIAVIIALALIGALVYFFMTSDDESVMKAAETLMSMIR